MHMLHSVQRSESETINAHTHTHTHTHKISNKQAARLSSHKSQSFLFNETSFIGSLPTKEPHQQISSTASCSAIQNNIFHCTNAVFMKRRQPRHHKASTWCVVNLPVASGRRPAGRPPLQVDQRDLKRQ